MGGRALGSGSAAEAFVLILWLSLKSRELWEGLGFGA